MVYENLVGIQLIVFDLQFAGVSATTTTLSGRMKTTILVEVLNLNFKQVRENDFLAQNTIHARSGILS